MDIRIKGKFNLISYAFLKCLNIFAMSMCYLLGKTIYLSFFCRCTFKTIFMNLMIWWRRPREWFWNNKNWVLYSCCYLFSHSIIRMLPEDRTSGNNWWKKGIARQSARKIALWLVFILLCKHGGSGKRLSQASGKTGEFWEKMRRWEDCLGRNFGKS